jgi:hypothetical protein
VWIDDEGCGRPQQDAFVTVWEAGRALTRDQAITDALGLPKVAMA